jgi:phage gp45-like
VVTITLPSSTITGKVITVKKTDAVNNVVVSRAGSATIDGATTKTITTQYGFLTVIADGTNWFIVASGGTIT